MDLFHLIIFQIKLFANSIVDNYISDNTAGVKSYKNSLVKKTLN